MRPAHYSKQDIVTALRAVGITQGDVVFSHIGLMQLGILKEAVAGENPATVIISAIQEVIGPKGSFITPTFSYSFCDGDSFDPEQTPSRVGGFGNQVRKMKDAQRSHDPLFSVTGIGPHISTLFHDLPNNSFGDDSLYARLLSLPCKICNFGVSLEYLTVIHHLEYKLAAPYRFNKVFSGTIVGKGEVDWDYFVRILCENSKPDCLPLQQQGTELGIVKRVPLGLGYLYSAPLKAYLELAEQSVHQDPWFLVKGPALEQDQLEAYKNQS